MSLKGVGRVSTNHKHAGLWLLLMPCDQIPQVGANCMLISFYPNTGVTINDLFNPISVNWAMA